MATYRVKPTHAGDYSGSSWANAMGWAEFATSAASCTAGDIYYFMEGAYTMTASLDLSAIAGTHTDPICIIGVNDDTTNEDPVYTDWSDTLISGGTDDRPVITCGTYSFASGTYFKLMHLIFKGTASAVIQTAAYNIIYNCKAEQSSETANRIGFNHTDRTTIYYMCEACGLVGTAVVARGFASATAIYMFYCWMHDCNSGVYLTTSGQGAIFAFCVFEDCSLYGAYTTAVSLRIINCTVHDCGTAFYATATFRVAVNNILEGCTTAGFSVDSSKKNTLFFRNHGDDTRNTDMWLNVDVTAPHYDPIVTTGDPLFDADGNLSLQASSPCKDAGKSMMLGT